jgi:four helix bundle protein
VRESTSDFEKWVGLVPEELTSDSLWKVEAYRIGLYVSEIGWIDVSALMKDKRTRSLSEQLFRSLGSISANIAEGYSRSSGRDKARFYEYALGSARESRDWYYKGKHILGLEVVSHRLNLLTQIIRLLIKMIPQQRDRKVSEDFVQYDFDSPTNQILDSKVLYKLLQDTPLPESS